MNKKYKLWLLLLPLVGSSGCVDAINKVGPTVGPFIGVLILIIIAYMNGKQDGKNERDRD